MRTAPLLVALLAVSSCAYADLLGDIKNRLDKAHEHGFGENLGKWWKPSHKDGQRKLLWTPGEGMDSFQTFMNDIMGRNWSQYVPQAWSNPNFGWDRLGTFDYSSNFHDFVDAVYANNFTKPQTLGDVHKNLEEITSIFCIPEKFTPSEKVYATCVGPTVTLAYVPKICVLEEITKEIVCDPAKIVLSKAPGGCTHKYHSPSSWMGKECKITGQAGFTQELTYGAANYTIPIQSISFAWEANLSP